MKSGLFKDLNITQSPTYMDQLSINTYIKTAHDTRLSSRGFQSSNGKHRMKKLDHEVTNYFADPRLYPSSSANLIKPCGRKVILTNGRRIRLAEINQPLDHCHSSTTRPQDRTIERYENLNNQFTDRERQELKSDPNYDAYNPFRRQLSIALEKNTELRALVVTNENLYEFTDLTSPIVLTSNILSRLELYKEYRIDPSKDIKKACERALRLAFGEATEQDFEIKRTKDQDDFDPTFLKWRVPQRFLSPELNGKTKCYIKFYFKGDWLRLEIQANKPNRVKSSNERKMMRDGLVTLTLNEEAVLIADIIAKSLEVIEESIFKVLSEMPLQDPESILVEKMVRRCRDGLAKNKYDSGHLLEAIKYLAKNRSIDKRTFESFMLKAPLLKKLSDAETGFLRKKEKSIGSQRKRYINPVYELVIEWLSRTGKHTKKHKEVKAIHVEEQNMKIRELCPELEKIKFLISMGAYDSPDIKPVLSTGSAFPLENSSVFARSINLVKK
jgi:hypothetical protein